jgi:hypothetical protein
MSITNPAECEVRSVIRFFNWKIIRPAEIYRKLVEVYGESVMNGGNVPKRTPVCHHRGFRRQGLMLTFMKTGDSLLMSDMKFCYSDTETFVPDGFQECIHWRPTSVTRLIVKLAQRLGKFMNRNGDYIEIETCCI